MQVAASARLILRHYHEDDAATFLGQLNEPSFHQYIADRGVRTELEARAYLQGRIIRAYGVHGFGMYLVTLKDGTPVGMAGLVRRQGLDDVDIGYALLPGFWGQGYALEACNAVLQLARTRLGMSRVLAITNVGNEASARLLDRLGFRFERMVVMPDETRALRLFSKSL